MIRPFGMFALVGMMCACSETQFKSLAPQQAKETAATADASAPNDVKTEPEAESQPSIDPSMPPPNAPLVKDEDKSALNECLKQWGKSPFTNEEITQIKSLNITEVVSNNGLIYSDDKATAKPTLLLVNFNINVGNNGELAFLNPNGWYCFNVKAKVINNFTIHAACETHVAIVSRQAQNDKNFAIQREEPCPDAPR